MDKVLFVATIDQHIRHFHMPFLKWFKENGYEVHLASNGLEKLEYVDIKYNVRFERSPLNYKNIKAYFDLKKIIKNNNYKLIHCNTPVASILTRLAIKNIKVKNTKVVYTAHGFHFFKGSPLINWLLFYPIEYWCSKYTDTLITINKEDFNLAKTKLKSKSNKLVNGVGVDLENFIPQNSKLKNNMRKLYDISEKDFVMIYVGELSNRKNQKMLINSMPLLIKKIPNLKLLLVGKGEKFKIYQDFIKTSDLDDYVCLLGYRTDINKLMLLSDIAVTTSKQEGLPVNIMEAMAVGLPIVATDCRGNRDLVENGKNGYLVSLYDEKDLSEKIYTIYSDKELYNDMKMNNSKLINKYSLKKIIEEMESMYKELL